MAEEEDSALEDEEDDQSVHTEYTYSNTELSASMTDLSLHQAKIVHQILTPNEEYNPELVSIANATMQKDWKISTTNVIAYNQTRQNNYGSA